MEVSVAAPIRNEEKNIKEFIDITVKTLERNVKPNQWELLLIDDASEDKTASIIDAASRKNRNIRVFHHENRKGQGGCFKTGFDNAKGEIIVILDSDLQVYPEEIKKFMDKMKQGYDYISGVREIRRDEKIFVIASRIYNILMLALFNSPLLDNSSPFRAVRKRFVQNLPFKGNDHRYLVAILQRRNCKRLGEIIVRHTPRREGKSKYSALPKYLMGLPELLMAWIRIKSGFYDLKK